jgi:hypothetical protein
MSKKIVLYVWGLLFSVVNLNGAEKDNVPKIIISSAAQATTELIQARNKHGEKDRFVENSTLQVPVTYYPKRSRKFDELTANNK